MPPAESAGRLPARKEAGLTPFPSDGLGAPLVSAPAANRAPSPINTVPSSVDSRRSETYYEVKGTIFGALIEAIDLAQLARLDADSAREEIRDIVNEIIAIKNIVMSISEQEELLDDICNDVLGFGPLEPLLSRDDISDIMVNGSGTVYIEVKGKIQKTIGPNPIRFLPTRLSILIWVVTDRRPIISAVRILVQTTGRIFRSSCRSLETRERPSSRAD